MWKMTLQIFIKSRAFKTPWERKNGFYVRQKRNDMFANQSSIKNVFVKMKNSIFAPKYTIYGKKFKKYSSDHFFIGDISFVYYWKILLKIKNLWFPKKLYEI